jgi:hypothetical protein
MDVLSETNRRIQGIGSNAGGNAGYYRVADCVASAGRPLSRSQVPSKMDRLAVVPAMNLAYAIGARSRLANRAPNQTSRRLKED